MSRYIRPRIPGASVFFTVTLADRGSRLLIDHVDALREAVRATKAERMFQIDAWVVLPDTVWTLPDGDADYSLRWRPIKARFSRGLPFGGAAAKPRSTAGKGDLATAVWERHIRNEADLAAHIRYSWINPVKHGFVKRPEDWP